MPTTQTKPKHKILQPCRNKAKKQIKGSNMLVVNLCNRHTPSFLKFLSKVNYRPVITDLPKNTKLKCAANVVKLSSEVNAKQKRLVI